MRAFPRMSAFHVALFMGSILTLSCPAAESSSPKTTTEAAERPKPAGKALFPGLYLQEGLQHDQVFERSQPYWVESANESAAAAGHAKDYQSVLLNRDILAFYGTPLSSRMGILGVHPKEEIDRMLGDWAARYDKANGTRGVQKAFYVIYGMAWPKGEIGILKDSKLVEYIEYAQKHDILVFVDHQIGKYSVSQAMDRILPFLRYPNVHLAIDPEWRTLKPMEEIGSISAMELNAAQKQMEDYIVAHGIPGERMLVVHQFNTHMITNREQVRSDFSRVRLVHCADGFGGPALKRMSYRYNALATNIPVKGFKLFFKSGVPGAGFDEPLLSPEEVVALNPRPYVIMYQ